MLEDTETKPDADAMPSLNHSYICAQVLRQLLAHDAIQPLPELTLAIGQGLAPDISVYPRERIQPDFFADVLRVEHLPVLAIEVISSSQAIQTVLDKARQLVEAGVEWVWVVEPYGRSIFVIGAGHRQLFHEEPVESAGIRVDFRQVFTR